MTIRTAAGAGLMRFSILIAIATLVACSPDGTIPAVTVRDSAGVRIVENPESAPALDWVLDDEPALDIGGSDLGEDYELYGVRSAARLSDGRIVIANGGTHELRFYSSHGVFLRSAGREGEGPGEFSRMGWMQHLGGDSLFVYDYDLRRIAVFSANGDFVRGVRLESTPDLPFASPIGVFNDRSMLARGFADTKGVPPDGLQRYESPIYHLDPEGLLTTELGPFSGNEVYYKAFDGGFGFFDAVFPLDTRFVVRDDVVYLAATDNFEIRVLTPDGKLSKIVRREHTRVPVTNEHLRLEIERRIAAEGPDERASAEATFDEIPKPEFFPAYLHILVDDDHNLWIQEYPIPGATTAKWSVFDSTGTLLGALDAPLGFEPYHIGDDFVLGKWSDELDVEVVKMYGLKR